MRRKTAIWVLLPTGVMLAALWAVAAAWAYVERQEVIDNHFLISRQLNSAVAAHFNGILQLVEISLDAAASELAARERGSEASHGHLLSLVEDLRKKSDGLVEISIAHPDGTVEFVPHTEKNPPVNASERDFFFAQMTGSPAGTFVGAPTASKLKSNRWIIPVTVVPQRTPKGVFPFAVIRVDRFAALHEQQRMVGGAIGVVRADGKVLSCTPLEARLPDMSFAGLEEFTTVWLKEDRGVYIAPHGLNDSKPRLMSFFRLKEYNLFVYVSTELERVLDPWRTRVTVVASGLGGITVIILIGAFYLRNQRVAREAHANKLEALGQLAGGIAHDFNNLLGAILGFAHFLVEDSPSESQQRRYAERVVMAGKRGRGLVQQILTFSRRTPGDPTDVRVADVVRETYDLLRATIPVSSQLVIEDDGGDLVVTGDRSQLGQVLVNLCLNASDALEERSGEVRISVAPLDRNRPELVRLPNCVAKPTPSTQSSWSDEDGFDWIGTGGLTAQDNICIRVSDTGSGIPREHFMPLFELFFTTKGSGGGTGIGLPLVQNVVTGHGGAILVRTKVGSGTTFDVILPRARPAFVELETVAITPAMPSHKPATILVIDDDRDFCDMLEMALRRLGHEVVSAHDPIEGLAAVEEDPSLWDLVVTDQTMPGMKGAEVISRIKQLRPSIRCIICTGYSSSLGESEALAAGADGFRSKPLDLDDFGAIVGQLLGSLS